MNNTSHVQKHPVSEPCQRLGKGQSLRFAQAGTGQSLRLAEAGKRAEPKASSGWKWGRA